MVVEPSIETCNKVASSWLMFLCVECVVVDDNDNGGGGFNTAKCGTSRGGLSSEKTTGTTRWNSARLSMPPNNKFAQEPQLNLLTRASARIVVSHAPLHNANNTARYYTFTQQECSTEFRNGRAFFLCLFFETVLAPNQFQSSELACFHSCGSSTSNPTSLSHLSTLAEESQISRRLCACSCV